MKIYDIVEGKWIEEEETEEKKKEKDYKKLDVRLRLITYDEEKHWIRIEKTLLRNK